jgi:hypothetical protein
MEDCGTNLPGAKAGPVQDTALAASRPSGVAAGLVWGRDMKVFWQDTPSVPHLQAQVLEIAA